MIRSHSECLMELMPLTLAATFQVTNSSARSSLCPHCSAVSITRLFLGYYPPLWCGTWWKPWNWYKSKTVCDEQIELLAKFCCPPFLESAYSENKQVKHLYTWKQRLWTGFRATPRSGRGWDGPMIIIISKRCYVFIFIHLSFVFKII